MAGVYIHMPFCRKLCFYCDFYHVIAPADTSGFINALIREITLRKDYLGNESIRTIYFGGGTPSIFSADDISAVMEHLRKEFNVEEGSEITIEMNPDDVNIEYLRRIAGTGINRISIGIQSWNDEELRMLNRRHDSRRAADALKDCFDAGFENVSADLIYGLPGMTVAGWEANLDTTFTYPIKHLSAYHLTIEKGTVFGKMLEKNLLKETDEDLSTALFASLVKKASEEGFVHYEISNFGIPGYFSKHNTNYWKQVNYIGLGPSAHSFNGYSRQWNKSSLNAYITAMRSGIPDFESEELDTRKKFNEYIMTSLRTMWGLDLEYVEKQFEKEGYDYVMNMSLKYRDYGLMKMERNTLVLTGQGMMISDNIISGLMMPGE
jgi:putative oxygen-independent coproporphyrinogen III oxidase